MPSLRDELEKKLHDSNAAPMVLPLEFLKAITCDFSTELELGSGGYGVVYKGVFKSGKIIAVKKLFEIHLLDDKTFRNEVRSLMEIKHRHVVQFIGYCAESSWETIKQPSGDFIWAELPKRLLCFEYVCNKSLHTYIYDESSVLDWNMRYEIIKGICSGLNFLHEECRIVHLDLKPENILMDATMIPKIADFGLSRIFGNQKSRTFTHHRAGSSGYMAPEYLIHGVVSMKADIFSLGVIMIEIITGCRDYPYFQLDSPQCIVTSCQHYIVKVLRSWRNKFDSTLNYKPLEKYSQQVEQCVTIALKCVDPAMEKRPTAKDIIQVLHAVDQYTDKLMLLNTTASKDITPPSVTEDMLINKATTGKVVDEAMYEGLSPMLTIESSTYTQYSHEGTKAPSEPQAAQDRTTEPEIIEDAAGRIYSIDAHQTEQLIITSGSHGHVQIWNYNPQASYFIASAVRILGKERNLLPHAPLHQSDACNPSRLQIKVINSIEVSREGVCCVKFIARKRWMVAVSYDCVVHVYSYENEMQKIRSFRAHDCPRAFCSLAVHPTQPYVLSGCHTQIKLWDWDQGWNCIQIFEEHSGQVCDMVFNPTDTNSFASAWADWAIKVWSLGWSKSKYTLCGHSGAVTSLDFFTRDGRQYLVTGSFDRTAKVWNMQKKKCVHTLTHNSEVSNVVSHPNLPVLVTGTSDGAVHVWNSTNFRLKRILNIGGLSGVKGLACLMGSERVAVAHSSKLSVMEIHDEEQGGSSSDVDFMRAAS
ncbi:uncharacterized protein LOC119339605 [Triticum dicoccoides]|uniref:uncharacterized protein LOC119339605 n=1 Tax=Triticum dicoccoides TaxID=85692 RepID=UPI001891003F|nr:uncharacterized protein LOC119339605 [Triticum dicoccoides]